jgi:hypothetical protein
MPTAPVFSDLHCPFPSKLNPGTEAAHHHTWSWATRFGLVRDANVERQVATERFTWLVGHFYPWAAAPELQLISDFTSWLFWFDDLCDETGLGEDPAALAAQIEWLVGVLSRRKEVRPGEPFDRAMADLRDRFEERSPGGGWFVRVVTSIQQYFEACLWEATNRHQGLVPAVGTFMDMRRFAGGMYIYHDFIELAERAELPLVARGNRALQRLVQLTCNVACWHNDLFSLYKELAYGDVHNLVVVLARQRQLTLTEALPVAVRLCDREAAAFVTSARRLPSFGPDTDALVARYRRGMEALMRGNLDWSLGTDRYRRHPAPEVRAAG